MRLARFTALVLGCLVAAPAGAVQVTVTPVVSEGDSVPGVGLVTSIDNVAINNAGTTLVEVDTDLADTNSDGALLRDASLYIRENAALAAPPGATLNTFDSVTLNNNGHSGWNFFLSGTGGTNNDSGIYLDTDLVLQEGTLSTSPGLSPGTPYIGFFDAKINDPGQIFVVASIDDPLIPSTVDRALMRWDVLPGGTLVSETVLAKEGDVLAGQTELVADFGTGPHQTAFNAAGDALYFADLTGLTTNDGVIYLNGTLLAQEGSPSPVPGRNYELLSSRSMDLNDFGGTVFKANLDGATTDDEVIVKDGAVLVREGDALPADPTFHFTAFGTSTGPVRIDNFGNVLWFGDWDDPNTDKDTGLFLNNQLIVAEGDDIGGMTLDEIASGEDAFDISSDGHWIIFEGTLLGGINAAFKVEVRDDPVPVEISDLALTAFADRIRIEWRLADPQGELAGIGVERALAAAGPFERMPGDELVPAARMSFEDTAVEPGISYWYRLVLHQTDGEVAFSGPVSGAAGMVSPGIAAAWESAADGSVHVRYAAPASAGSLRLQVHDVRGRVVWARDGLRSSGVLAETTWDRTNLSGGRSPRGVYFVRVTGAGFTASQKVVAARP